MGGGNVNTSVAAFCQGNMSDLPFHLCVKRRRETEGTCVFERESACVGVSTSPSSCSTPQDVLMYRQADFYSSRLHSE